MNDSFVYLTTNYMLLLRPVLSIPASATLNPLLLSMRQKLRSPNAKSRQLSKVFLVDVVLFFVFQFKAWFRSETQHYSHVLTSARNSSCQSLSVFPAHSASCFSHSLYNTV